MERRARCCFVGLALAVSACSEDGPGQDGSTSGSGIGSFSDGSTDDGDGDLDDDGPKLDAQVGDGTENAGDEGGGQGCEKVDFLFVIDSSPSMADEQDNLLASFPGFIAAIEDALMIDDFHVMAIDAGSTPGGGCEGTLGAGRTTSGAGQDCGIVGGTRYVTEQQPDLVDAFTCMGSRGIDGNPDEQTMDALLAALGPLDAPGGCNEGFLRDDAVLVVTIISDEEDSPADLGNSPVPDGSCQPADGDPNSSGEPNTWRDAVLAAKNDDPNAMVVLALVGDCDIGGDCAGILIDPLDPAAAVTGAEPAPRLREFATSFGYGSVGPICADDFAPFFADAVSVIANACEGFVPPG